MKQYNLSNLKKTMKRLHARIKINKLQVHMILSPNKIPRANLKRNKNHGIVIFVSMNAVNNSPPQPLNTPAHDRKRQPVR